MIRRVASWPVGARWALGIAVLALLLNSLGAILDYFLGGERDGPRSSSYVTAEHGVAAYADLLASSGHDITQVRTDPSAAGLDPTATVVLLDPIELAAIEARTLRSFVNDGGRLIVGATSPGEWFGSLFGSPPVWNEEGARESAPLVPLTETTGVESVVSSGSGAWESAGETLPLLGSGGTVIASVADLGEGRVVALADPTILHNVNLGRQDNAAFGLRIAGASSRPVWFVESVHGFRDAGGMSALPAPWRWTAVGLLLAGLVFIAAHWRRLGPPEREARDLPPPRREYVDALAASLTRMRLTTDMVEPVRQRARALVVRRAGLKKDADDREVKEAAIAMGMPEGQVRVLFDIASPQDLVIAGRALARLTRGDR